MTQSPSRPYPALIADLTSLDRTDVPLVGGKAAGLGELRRVEGVRVPPGFCVTTRAFRAVVSPAIRSYLNDLARLSPGETTLIDKVSATIWGVIDGVDLPDEVTHRIDDALLRFGGNAEYAVRSSATAEDLPSASFAGQHDTHLNVVGTTAVAAAVRQCWSSLFSPRAVLYRARNGIDHRHVEMAVVIQRMVAPTVSGVLFTADPVTGYRRSAVVEATTGLGDALVSGSIDPDGYVVREGAIVDRRVRTQPLLDDGRILSLVTTCRRIEAHFGRPQDIEWCLDDDGFAVVQSRPITTLFPVPQSTREGNRLYVSVGHGQMMTDAMTPLGLSVWQMSSPADTLVAGSRLFVDVTEHMASPKTREATLAVMGRSDPRMRDALETVVADGFVADHTDADPDPVPPLAGGDTVELDPAVLPELMKMIRASLAELQHQLAARSGPAVLDLIRTDLAEGKVELTDPRSRKAVMAGFEANWWLNDKLEEWLGEKAATDVLSRSAPNNVTADMGLTLLDVADAIRPHPDVVATLREATDDTFFEGLDALPDAGQARAAIRDFLDLYGMRCVGEIDLGRPRWRERPTALTPAILANVENFEPGERDRRVQAGLLAAHEAQRSILRRRELPDGNVRADEAERMIAKLRSFIGYREFPKCALISRFAIYNEALLAEARRLVQEDVLDDPDDIFLLTFDELDTTIRDRSADRQLIEHRRQELRDDAALRPPRVLTSDGEVVDGTYRRDDVPPDVLIGLGISGGAVEGRARVIHDLSDAHLEPGDILVTTDTDPSWTPVFVNVAGLVTEVGGLTTHGAVIAREYGLVSVVGVEKATTRISDGQRIRVNGTDGFVELLTTDSTPGN